MYAIFKEDIEIDECGWSIGNPFYLPDLYCDCEMCDLVGSSSYCHYD
jgi:hypothetical protein